MTVRPGITHHGSLGPPPPPCRQRRVIVPGESFRVSCSFFGRARTMRSFAGRSLTRIGSALDVRVRGITSSFGSPVRSLFLRHHYLIG